MDFDRKNDTQAWARKIVHALRHGLTAVPSRPPKSPRLWPCIEGTGSGRELPGRSEGYAAGVLTSPQFLFLLETSATPAPEPLDNFELASKLSYFLWNGPPDARLCNWRSNGLLEKSARQ